MQQNYFGNETGEMTAGDRFLLDLKQGIYYKHDAAAQTSFYALPEPDIKPLEWAQRFRSIDGRPFSLDLTRVNAKLVGFEPLKQIYNDDHPCKVIQKPAQKGLSELAVTIALHALDVGDRFWKTGKIGLNVGYLFPTKEALSDFSKERFTGLKDESEYLARLFGAHSGAKGFDDVTFKQVRNSYLYLRGTNSVKGLKSFPVDVLIFDEFDEMESAKVALAEKRLIASLVNRKLYLSTPTIENKGINKLYLTSDRHVWQTLCRACGQSNELDFFRDVFADGEPRDIWKDYPAEKLKGMTYTVHCPNCSIAIPDNDRYTLGAWVSEQPEVTSIRGYKVPALCFPSCRLNELAANSVSFDPTVITEFYRSDLGIPYEPEGSRLTETQIKAMSDELDGGVMPSGGWYNTTMGVDVGKYCHYRISSTALDGKRYVRAMGKVRSVGDESMWQKLSKLMKEFKVKRVVVDMKPELDACATWSRLHKGVIFRADYPTGVKALQASLYAITATGDEQDKAKKEEREPVKDVMQINRTRAMDAVYNIIVENLEIWSPSCSGNPEVIANMTAPNRVVAVNKEGDEFHTWEHSRPDHYYHACVYDYVAYSSLPKKLRGAFSAGTSAQGWQPKN